MKELFSYEERLNGLRMGMGKGESSLKKKRMSVCYNDVVVKIL